MLSEAAHSVADTVTEVLLLTALKRSEKPADDDHPLGGYGPERYIWALLASVATFVGGAVFSIYDGGVHTLLAGEDLGSPLLSYLVLVVAFLLEGFSLRTGLKQVREEAQELGRTRPALLPAHPGHGGQGRRDGGLGGPARPAVRGGRAARRPADRVRGCGTASPRC